MMKTLTFKVDEDEARRVRAVARREGVSLSEYLRRRIRAGAGDERPVGRVRCRRTGARIFAGAAQHPPLTSEAVREMLADFP